MKIGKTKNLHSNKTWDDSSQLATLVRTLKPTGFVGYNKWLNFQPHCFMITQKLALNEMKNVYYQARLGL